MDRKYVIDNQLVQRYIRGKLDSAEQEAFEAYYLDCPETLVELEIEKTLSEGLAQQPLHSISVENEKKWWWERLLSPPTPFVAAAMAVVVLMQGIFLFIVHRDNEILVAEMAELMAPRVNEPAISLSIRRSVDNLSHIILTPEQRSLRLELEVRWPPAKLYQISIYPSGGETALIQLNDIVPGQRDWLEIGLSADKFDAGEYVVKIVGDNQEETIYNFSILHQ